MNPSLLFALLAAVPAGWAANLLAERVPDRVSLRPPWGGLTLRGRALWVLLATVATVVALGLRFTDDVLLVTVAYVVAGTGLIALCAIDIERYRLPDAIVLPLLAVSIPLLTAAALVGDDAARIRYALAGGAGYFAFLMLFHLIWPRGMGFGDVKLAALLGLLLGFVADDALGAVSLVLYGMLIGFLTGAVAGFVLFLARRRSTQFPFGPFLVFGTLVAVLASGALLPAPAAI